jgi:hypothetical protein
LFGRFAGDENNCRKSFSRRAVSVHLSKPEVHDRRCLESVQNLFAAHTARSKLLEQFESFSRRHRRKMRQKSKNPSAKS